MTDQCPDANVELSPTEEERCLDILLYDKRRILDLFDTCTGGLLLFWVRILLVLGDLVRKFLYLFVPLSEILGCAVAVLWSRRGVSVVIGHAYLDPVVRPKDILEVLDRIEDVNADSTIETGRL